MEMIDEYYCPFCANNLVLANQSGYKKIMACKSNGCSYQYTYIDSPKERGSILETFLSRIKRLDVIRA